MQESEDSANVTAHPKTVAGREPRAAVTGLRQALPERKAVG